MFLKESHMIRRCFPQSRVGRAAFKNYAEIQKTNGLICHTQSSVKLKHIGGSHGLTYFLHMYFCRELPFWKWQETPSSNMQLHYCNHFLLPFVARHGGIIATHVGQQFLQIQFSSKETIGNS